MTDHEINNPPPDSERDLLSRRLRLGLAFMGASIPLFAIADWRSHPELLPALLPYKALQVAALVIVVVALRARPNSQHLARLSHVAAGLFFVGVVGHAALRHDVYTAAVNLFVTVYVEAFLLPVSFAAHATVAAMAAFAVLSAAYLAQGSVDGVLTIPALPFWVAGAAAPWIGYELQRNRQELLRLRGAAEQRAEESEALGRVTREMIASFDTPALLHRLCEVTATVLHCDFARTIFHRSSDDTFALAASFGDSVEQQAEMRVLNLPRALFADLVPRLEAGEIVQLAPGEARDTVTAGLQSRLGVTRAMFVPLLPGGKLVGVLIAGFRGPVEPFSALAERVAGGIARAAALALENARLVAELDSANSVKDEFVATMSHELRSPLNILIGYSDLLLEGAFETLREPQRNVVERMRQQSEQLLSMINATLDLSRLEAGGVRLPAVDIDVARLVADLERETPLNIKRPGVQLAWSVEGNLPLLRVDQIKLKVVLANLIQNALKFTEHGTVSLHARQHQQGIEFVVADTGIGIAPEARQLIFEPFRQADASIPQRFGGTGLGLYIVRRMVDLLGGRLTLDSAVGHGSTFRVWLPLVPPATLRDDRAQPVPQE